MSTLTPLGLCPECDAVIPRSGLLIEYESDARRSVFAECPGCGEAVSPGPIRIPSLDPGE